ncbi:LysR substrate-binding domain-containing protein [Kitasatospora sp. NPDC091257]|uniref:LysR substrate-binding domain-containing protein n=1 Tax=Kitasatospora sp. NPDC091257 TaxID=3364084 RepID=UPI00380EF1F0
MRRTIRRSISSASGRPVTGPLVASVEQLLEVVALGQAVAFLARSTTERYQRPDIAYRPVTGLSPSAVMVAWPETSRSAAVAAFVQAAHDVAAHQPDHMTALA